VTFSAQELTAIETALAQLCPSWPFNQIAIEQYLTGGYRNRNYRLSYNGERYVLRIATSDAGADYTTEQELLAALARVFPYAGAGVDLDVAAVVASCAAEGLLLSRWHSAPLLAACHGITAETLGIYLAKLHGCLARLPASVVSSGDLASHIRADLAAACGSEATAAACLAALPKPQYAPRRCHLDLNPWNLLVANNRWVTLDWETLAIADPLFDLVTLCDGYLRQHDLQADRREFSCAALLAYNYARESSSADDLQGYSEQALSDARLWYQWREYGWACAQIAAGNKREEIVLQRNFFAAELVANGFDILPG